eukprot:s2335_g16.t1
MKTNTAIAGDETAPAAAPPISCSSSSSSLSYDHDDQFHFFVFVWYTTDRFTLPFIRPAVNMYMRTFLHVSTPGVASAKGGCTSPQLRANQLASKLGIERQKLLYCQDLHRWKTELHLKLERIHELDRQREKYATDLQQAKQRCEAAQEELRGREVQMAQLKRSIADAVRTDKNLYSKNLVESLEEISEMRKKFKVMCHQIEQLKEEIKEKDVAMIAEHFKHQNISKETLKTLPRFETEKTKHTLEFHEKQQTKSQQVVEQQLSDIKKLEATIQEAETERQHQRKEFEAVTSERNILGKQLIRRNEELSLIYEKIKIQEGASEIGNRESTLGKGEAQYKKLLESLRGQRGSIATLKRDLFIAQQQAESASGLEKEVYHLQRELLQERTKVRALSEELENPMTLGLGPHCLEASVFESRAQIARAQPSSDSRASELIQKAAWLQMEKSTV